MKCKATLAMVVVASLAGGEISHADLDGDKFRSDQWKVSIEGPKGWQLTESTSYPSILLWMVHRRPDARMLFSAEPLTAIRDSQTYATETAKKLQELGYQVRAPQLHSATGAYWLDFDDGEHFLRQALLVVDDTRIGYSLTLSAADVRIRGQFLRAFDFSLRHLIPRRPKKQATPNPSP